ncbi:hypothetical protein [Mumia sp. DW29H23]|uniref:hypothetical protein n=1 Tax=Mumia sp. DW29H23 TaxID=3421241 RepID=UPI003D693ACF
MDPTVVVAGMGFATSLVSVWLTGRSQHRTDREGRILEARLRVYAECYDSLFDYSRATYDRVKARLEDRPESERDVIRQEAYRCNARARSAIGQAYILTGDSDLEKALSGARRTIGRFNGAADGEELKQLQDEVYDGLKAALEMARRHLANRRSRTLLVE